MNLTGINTPVAGILAKLCTVPRPRWHAVLLMLMLLAATLTTLTGMSTGSHRVLADRNCNLCTRQHGSSSYCNAMVITCASWTQRTGRWNTHCLTTSWLWKATPSMWQLQPSICKEKTQLPCRLHLPLFRVGNLNGNRWHSSSTVMMQKELLCAHCFQVI